METTTIEGFKLNINVRLNYLLKVLAYAQLVAGAGVLLSLGLKLTHAPGQVWVFVFFMSVLAFLFLLQTGVSLTLIYAHPKLAFLGGFSSLSLALAFITLVFKYQHWWGSYIMLILTLPILVLSLSYLVYYFFSGQHRHTAHRKFLYHHLVGPFVFIVFLWVFYLVLHDFIVTPDMRHRRSRTLYTMVLPPALAPVAGNGFEDLKI